MPFVNTPTHKPPDSQPARGFLAGRLARPLGRLTDPTLQVSRTTLVVLAATVILMDQVTKGLAVTLLKDRAPVVLVPGCLQLIYNTNTGAAFSILQGRTGLLSILSAGISLVLLIWAWRLGPHEQGLRIGFGLILGGAIGNLIDRLRLGEVIDFIDAHLAGRYHWPTFNIADSAVCVGIFLLIVASFRIHPEPKAGPRLRRHKQKVDPST